MIYTEKTKRALEICFDAHKDQKDKSGMPYVFHPFHLAEQMDDGKSTIVALLHDVMEDAGDRYSFESLRAEGFGDEVMEALALLTHGEDQYFDYIRKVRKNPLAAKVKRADLLHNSDLRRLNEITKWDWERVEKYKRALDILDGAED